eukprot:Tbor_TRINITY_DN292_c0_g1::TRINITY_DN292_c0_g1_i1::g.12238::m.12238
MIRKSICLLTAPWRPPNMGDIYKTVPPPPSSDVGGSGGVSMGYSDRISRTPYWRRMATTTYQERMTENATYYPFIGKDSTEYSVRYLPKPYKDNIRNRPLFEIGEPHNHYPITIPVIFLVNLYEKKRETYLGKKLETVYVSRKFAKNELIPQRYAVYATTEAYSLLGLPVVDHRTHETLPKTESDFKKHIEKRSWTEERWKFTIDYLFRKYEEGPPELLEGVVEEWDGNEELGISASASGSTGASGGRKGPVKQRKARKTKLF